MDDIPIPEGLRDAIAAHHRRWPPAPLVQRQAVRGDIVVVSHAEVTRLVCVTDVVDTHLVGVLCSNEVEMATDHDVIVYRSGTYDLLLEAELHLVFLPVQVQGVVDTVDLDAVSAVLTSLRSDGESVEQLVDGGRFGTGLPLGGIDDPRREFAANELADVVVLRNPAHRVLFDDAWNPGYIGDP